MMKRVHEPLVCSTINGEYQTDAAEGKLSEPVLYTTKKVENGISLDGSGSFIVDAKMHESKDGLYIAKCSKGQIYIS